MIRIREAMMDDAEQLQRYAAKLFAERLLGLFERPAPSLDEEREFIHGFIEPTNSVLLLAEENGVIVGNVGFEGRRLPQEAHVGLFGLSVDSEHRGRGIGSELVAALLEWAPTHGVRRVEVEAFANNPRAIELYERLGFGREGWRRGAVMVEGELVDVLLLARIVD